MNSRSRAIPSKLASEIQGPWQGGNWAEALRFLFENSALQMDGQNRELDFAYGTENTKKYADPEATPAAQEFCVSNQCGLKTVTRQVVTNTKTRQYQTS